MNCPYDPLELLMVDSTIYMNRQINPIKFNFRINTSKILDKVFQTWLLEKLDKDIMRIARPLPFVAALLELSERETYIVIISAKISIPSRFKVYEDLRELPEVHHDNSCDNPIIRDSIYNAEMSIRKRSLKDNLWPFLSCESSY